MLMLHSSPMSFSFSFSTYEASGLFSMSSGDLPPSISSAVHSPSLVGHITKSPASSMSSTVRSLNNNSLMRLQHEPDKTTRKGPLCLDSFSSFFMNESNL